MPQIKDELRALDQSPPALRRFGLTVGTAMLVLGLLFVWRHRFAGWPLTIAAFVLVLLAILAPRALQPVQKVWMALAFTMGWIMTRLILTIVFYLVVTPIGILQRIFGQSPLDLSYKTGASSYWEKREGGERTLVDYERQF